jgi:hypothetical protein
MELELEILERSVTRKGECTISLARKTGLITLSTEFIRSAKLQEGSCIALAKDPKREKDWYLVVFLSNVDPKGIPGRLKGPNTGLVINSSAWANQFLDQFGKEKQGSIRVPMGKEFTEILGGRAKAYPILTKSLEV